MTMESDIKTFIETGGNIIIGTPGKIKYFLSEKENNEMDLNLKELEVLILGWFYLML